MKFNDHSWYFCHDKESLILKSSGQSESPPCPTLLQTPDHTDVQTLCSPLEQKSMATLETAHFWAGSDLWEGMSTVNPYRDGIHPGSDCQPQPRKRGDGDAGELRPRSCVERQESWGEPREARRPFAAPVYPCLTTWRKRMRSQGPRLGSFLC